MIDGIEKNLALQEHHTEPSRATLRDYGNTSSSSIWCVIVVAVVRFSIRASLTGSIVACCCPFYVVVPPPIEAVLSLTVLYWFA